ncbi:cell division site-positioning protein MapZ family protein [Vagococcus fessus]|nr:cell division site-positioning protein MapZ family protein [Vagococcus fessus]
MEKEYTCPNCNVVTTDIPTICPICDHENKEETMVNNYKCQECGYSSTSTFNSCPICDHDKMTETNATDSVIENDKESGTCPICEYGPVKQGEICPICEQQVQVLEKKEDKAVKVCPSCDCELDEDVSTCPICDFDFLGRDSNQDKKKRDVIVEIPTQILTCSSCGFEVSDFPESCPFCDEPFLPLEVEVPDDTMGTEMEGYCPNCEYASEESFERCPICDCQVLSDYGELDRPKDKEKRCPNCGEVSTENSNYCPNCDGIEALRRQVLGQLPLAKVVQSDELVTRDTIKKEEVKDVMDITSEENNSGGCAIMTDKKMNDDKNLVDSVLGATKQHANEKTAPKIESNSNTSNRQPKEPKEPKKQINKKPLITVAAVAVLLGGGYIGATKYQENIETQRLTTIKTRKENVEKNLKKLYLNDEKIFLSETFEEQHLNELAKEVASIEDPKFVDKVSPDVEDLTARATLQGKVNDLFETPLIVGDKLSDKAALKEESPKLPDAIKEPKDGLEKLFNKGIDKTKEQIKTIEEAKKAVAVVFDKNVKKEATAKQLDEAKKAVEKLKAGKLKDGYLAKLDKVSATLDKDKKAKADKDSKEEKAKKEKAAKEKEAKLKEEEKAKKDADKAKKDNEEAEALADNDEDVSEAETPAVPGEDAPAQAEGQAAPVTPEAQEQRTNEQPAVQKQGNGDVTYVDPETGKKTAVKDGISINERTPGSTTAGDWSWAPGIYDNFINTCIARGYIVPGGYEIRQSEIINGEPYYDLYATNLESPVSKAFSENELPIFIVKVNAKTGWFKGTAPY